jgi:hypothetical protein
MLGSSVQLGVGEGRNGSALGWNTALSRPLREQPQMRAGRKREEVGCAGAGGLEGCVIPVQLAAYPRKGVGARDDLASTAL